MYEFDELKNPGTLQCEISVSLSLYFFQFDACVKALLTTESQSGRFQSDCSHKKIVNHSKLTLRLYKIMDQLDLKNHQMEIVQIVIV